MLLGFSTEGVSAQVGAPVRNLGAAALADLVMERFARGSPAAFDSVYPFVEGRSYVADAARRKVDRHPGLARVVQADSTRAVLLLSGYVAAEGPGSETVRTRAFADFYEATRTGGVWSLSRRLPLDAEN